MRRGDVVLGVLAALLGVWLAYHLLHLSGAVRPGGKLHQLSQLGWQVGGLLALEQAYEVTRGRIPHETDLAMMNAYRLLDLEWRHGLFVESRLERYFLQFHGVMTAIDLFYVFSHVAVTLGALVWIYFRCRRRYPFIRNLFMLTTAIALVAFYLYPTAPPRMLGNYGFVDPLQLHHLVGAGGEQPGSYTYNPYAAMPSLHVGYALIVAIGMVLTERRLWIRALACIYPFAMAAAVVISGNHWVLDAVGAFVTVAISALALLLASRASTALQSAIARPRYSPLLSQPRPEWDS